MTIAVIGAGASGMMAALTAAEQPENKILLFERQARVGRKLAVTGNGRCNLTNTGAAPENYHGAQPDFAAPALAAFPPEAALRWFAAHGLMTVTEPGGRVYPLSNAANSVVDVLRFALARPNITLRAGEAVTAVRRQGHGFVIETESETIPADRVIIACGGAAGAKAGGVRDGYTLLQSLGHRRTALHPALVQLTTDPTYPRALKGVRADARVTLTRGRAILARSAGEVQFTEKGVSGPAILRNFPRGELRRRGPDRDARPAARTQRAGLSGVFAGAARGRAHAPVRRGADRHGAQPRGQDAAALRRRPRRAAARRRDGPANSRRSCARRRASRCRCAARRASRARRSRPAASARTNSTPRRWSSRLVPGLYACGEVLDIDGDCGGYNLQWAWASGRAAGRACR